MHKESDAMRKLVFTPCQSAIVRAIQEQTQGSIYVVGGAIRDLLLGKTPKDIDFATDLRPEGIRALANTLRLTVVPDQTAWDHGIVRVVDNHSGDIIDIATLRKDDDCDGRHAKISFTESIQDDLERRDFTINGMAAEVEPDGLISGIIKHRRGDVEDGEWDIEQKRVLFIGNPEDRIKEDALRMLRACRFTALDRGWRIATSSKAVIKKHASEITQISKERIHDELLKAMSYPNPGGFVRSLNDTGLLQYVIPSVHNCIDVEGNEYHNETVYEHCIASLDAAVSLSKSPYLRLAALLHDVGKPDTLSVDKDNHIHFYRHEVKGASVAYKYLTDMRFSRKEAEYISKLIRHHQWRFERDSKDKTIRRWLQKVGKDTWKDLIILRCADRRGNLAKKDKPMMTAHMKELVSTVQRIIASGEAIFKEDLAINGNDLKSLGVPPGPIYKEIFQNMLGIVVAEPEKNNKVWLTEFVRKNYIKE